MLKHLVRGALVAALTLVLLPASALAKGTAWESIDVTRHTDDGVTLIAGTLPASVRLPAEAELSVPAGSELQWIGEILGGDASADPSVQYVKSTSNGLDVYRFSVTKSRTAQIELKIPGGEAAEGAATRSTLNWKAFADVPEVTLGAQIPAGAQIVAEAEGARYSAIGTAAGFYSKTFTNVKKGDELGLSFAFQGGGAPVGGGAAPATGGSDTMLVFVLVMLAAATGVTVTLVFAQRSKARLLAELEAQRAQEAKPRRKRAKAVVEEAFDDDDAFTDEMDEADEEPAPARRSASRSDADIVSEPIARAPRSGATIVRNAVTLGLIGVLVVVGIIIGSEVSKPQVTGDTIAQTFSSGQPCDKAQYPVTVPAGSDPVKVAQKLFAALKTVDGMNTATYNISSTTLNVDYCGSKTNEPTVTKALSATGMVSGPSAPSAQ